MSIPRQWLIQIAEFNKPEIVEPKQIVKWYSEPNTGDNREVLKWALALIGTAIIGLICRFWI